MEAGTSKKVGDYPVGVSTALKEAQLAAREACIDFISEGANWIATGDGRNAGNTYSSAVIAVHRLNQFRSEFLEAQRG